MDSSEWGVFFYIDSATISCSGHRAEHKSYCSALSSCSIFPLVWYTECNFCFHCQRILKPVNNVLKGTPMFFLLALTPFPPMLAGPQHTFDQSKWPNPGNAPFNLCTTFSDIALQTHCALALDVL